MKPVTPSHGGNRTPKLEQLLTPSWLSGVVAILAGLAVTVGVALAFSFNGSQFQQELANLQNTSLPTLTLPGQAPPGNTQNSLQNTWPLLGFWGVVGLIIYFVVETVVQLFHEAEEFREELGYVNAKRDRLIRTAVEYLGIRLLAVLVWLIFIQIFFRRIVPYSILAAHAGVSDLHSFQSLLYLLTSFFMIALSFHLHTIFLRLSLRRPRVFSPA